MITMASRDGFGGFTFAAFNVKSIPVATVVTIIPSLIESSMFFFQSKLLIYCIRFFITRSKAYNVVLVYRLFMDDLSCLLVVCKKYANTNGKNSKNTNAIDISITGSCGRGRCRRHRVIQRGRGRRC